MKSTDCSIQRMGPPHTIKQRGVTLLELMTVVLILSLVLTLAASYGGQWFDKNRTRSTLASLQTVVAYARTTAHSRQRPVVLCPSANGKQCSGQWSDGMILFVSLDGSPRVKQGDDILRVLPGVRTGTLSWQGFRGDAFIKVSANPRASALNGRFVYRPSPGARGASLVINRLGRTRIVRGTIPSIE